MPPNVFVGHVTGDFLPAADWNTNWALTETSFLDHGSYVTSGLVASIGTGLSVNVTAGHAIIGADINFPSTFVIASLTDATTNHLYGLQNGTGTSNTTGTAPANSVKLGTATTAGGIVTAVAMGRTTGRQQFRQPQDLIPGGPASGTTSAGHPDGLNLANWGATDAEGQAFYGTLPAGAFAAAAPITFTVSDAGTTTEPTILTLQHRSSGTPTTSFGNTFLMRADNASNTVTNQLSVATGWSSAAAGAENSLAIFKVRIAGVDTEVARLNAVGNGQLRASADFAHTGTAAGFYNTTPITQPVNTTDLRQAIINLGLLATGGATPLNLNGGQLTAAGLFLGQTTTAVNYPVTDADTAIFGDTTGGNITVTLPTAVGRAGRIFIVKKVLGANNVVVQAAGVENIDNANTAVIMTLYASISVISDNVGWWIW